MLQLEKSDTLENFVAETSSSLKEKHISDDWVAAWHASNLIYPQTFTGYKASVGPLLVRELVLGKSTLFDIITLPFSKEKMTEILEHSKKVHSNLKIPGKIARENVEILWSRTLSELVNTLFNQTSYSSRLRKKNRSLGQLNEIEKVSIVNNFFANPTEYHEDYEWIIKMWEAIRSDIYSRRNKVRAKLITNNLRAANNANSLLELSEIESINTRYWYDIRQSCRNELLTLELPFNTPKKRRLVTTFVDDIVQGNSISVRKRAELKNKTKY